MDDKLAFVTKFFAHVVQTLDHLAFLHGARVHKETSLSVTGSAREHQHPAITVAGYWKWASKVGSVKRCFVRLQILDTARRAPFECGTLLVCILTCRTSSIERKMIQVVRVEHTNRHGLRSMVLGKLVLLFSGLQWRSLGCIT